MEDVGLVQGFADLICFCESISWWLWTFRSQVPVQKPEARELSSEHQRLYGVLCRFKFAATWMEKENPELRATKTDDLSYLQTCRTILSEIKLALYKIDPDAINAETVWPIGLLQTTMLAQRISKNKKDLKEALCADSLSSVVAALSCESKILDAAEVSRFDLRNKLNGKSDSKKKKNKDCELIDPSIPVEQLMDEAILKAQTRIVRSLVDPDNLEEEERIPVTKVKSNLNSMLDVMLKRCPFEDLDVQAEIQRSSKQAAIVGWVECFRVMVAHGIDTQGLWPSEVLNSNDEQPRENVITIPWKQQQVVYQHYVYAMLQAVETSNVDLLEGLLKSGFSPDTFLNSDDDTAAHYACRANSVALLKVLHRYGGHTDIKNVFGDLPLHIAAWMGKKDACAYLLEKGADIRARNSGMQTALHIAATHDHEGIVKLILAKALKQKIKWDMLEYRDCERRTALMKALENENLQISKLLIDAGSDVHVKYYNGLNVFYFASEFADRELIETLIFRGVDVNNTTFGGFNSLHHTAARATEPHEMVEHAKICLRLIEAGASLSSDNPARVSPLHCACHSGNHYLVQELLLRLPAVEVNTNSNYYGTPLYTAAFRGHLQIVRMLLEAGADLGMPSKDETPLEAAIAEGHHEVAALLSEIWWNRQQNTAINKIIGNLNLSDED